MEKLGRPLPSQSLEELAKVLAKHNVQYLIIGKAGAIVYGFPDTTQDIDIFPEKSLQNGRRMVSALKEVGFHLEKALEQAILEGKDFIQMRGDPFDLDLVFAPDGFTSFQEAKKRASLFEGYIPVAALDEIIKSKQLAARQKDKEVLARLEAFARYLRSQK